MLTRESRLFCGVPPNLQWQISCQVISTDMCMGCIRNAAIANLGYGLSLFYELPLRDLDVGNVHKHHDLILSRQNLDG